jgi:hypothetical protein
LILASTTVWREVDPGVNGSRSRTQGSHRSGLPSLIRTRGSCRPSGASPPLRR